jgi:hypothetical protein
MYSYSPKRDLVTDDNNIIVIANTGENIDEAEPLRVRPLSYVLAKLEQRFPGVIINVCVVSFTCSSLKVDRHSVSESEERLLNRNTDKRGFGGRTRNKKRKHNNTRKKRRKHRKHSTLKKKK